MNRNSQCRVCFHAAAVKLSPFCAEHEEAWRQSPEHRRSLVLNSNEVRISALADFVTRVRNEQGASLGAAAGTASGG